MDIMKVRDENNNWITVPAFQGPRGPQGNDYVLTQTDIETIASMVDPTAIGAALASMHNIKTYYSLAQISASLGTTPRLQDVWTAMPQYSLLICPSTLFDAQDMPSANTGTVEMYKGITVSSGFIEFHGRNATTASANFIKRPNAVGTTGPWEQVSGTRLKAAAAFAIPSSGSSVSYDMPGLTADFELDAWNYSASAENSPPADLTWTTYDGYFTIMNTSGTTSETIQPVFALPMSVEITIH